MKAEYVLFDLDGTLYDFAGFSDLALRDVLRTYTPVSGDPEEASALIAAAFWKGLFVHAAPARSGACLSAYEMLESIFAGALLDSGASSSLAQAMTRRWFQSFFSSIRPYSGVLPLLQTLKSAGIGCGIVSNGPEELQMQKLEALGIAQYFDRRSLVFSERYGAAKPDPAIFLEAVRAQGSLPEKGIYVGDSPVTDISGALEVGLCVIWLNRYGLAAPAAVQGRVYEAASFDEAARRVMLLL
ncbi:MAG: HAD family hydrolase [Bacillota bacterium]